MNVLIIDDETELLEIWSMLFVSLGQTVILAKDGRQGIQALGEQQIDLVITDIRMPVADGFQVLEHLKNNVKNDVKNDVKNPILIFVCSGFIDDEQRALEPYKVTRVIRKPFSFGDELRYFDQLLNKKQP